MLRKIIPDIQQQNESDDDSSSSSSDDDELNEQLKQFKEQRIRVLQQEIEQTKQKQLTLEKQLKESGGTIPTRIKTEIKTNIKIEPKRKFPSNIIETSFCDLTDDNEQWTTQITNKPKINAEQLE
jgi:hypothetical protein